ncbi:MAG: vibriolysin, partial [Acidobacteriota bacterium]|nr:vibriolysin [Acidobacteriota bacterium]
MNEYKEDLQMKRKKRMFERKLFFAFTLVIMVCCFMVTSSWAARKVDLTSANAGNFIGQLNRNGAAMGPVFGLSQDEQFRLLRQTRDFKGVTHSRYEQTYKGIPVWGMQTIVGRDRSNNVSKLHGNLALGIPDDVVEIPNASSLNPQAALRQRQDLHKGKDSSAVWNFRNEKYGTYIYLDKKDNAHLCYVVSFFADTDRGNPAQPIFFIDVKSGKVLDSYDMLR